MKIKQLLESTSYTHNNQHVATRVSTANGPVLQMAFTPEEWEKWRNLPVESESGQTWETAQQLVDELNILISWDTAGARNSRARSLEQHRFINHPVVGDTLKQQAATERSHARHATKSSMSAV